MTDELIYKAVERAVEKTVPPTVERVVNGKINKLQETLDKHIEDEGNYRDKLEPIIEFLHTFNNLNRFLKWGGITMFAFFTALYLFFKKGV